MGVGFCNHRQVLLERTFLAGPAHSPAQRQGEVKSCQRTHSSVGFISPFLIPSPYACYPSSKQGGKLRGWICQWPMSYCSWENIQLPDAGRHGLLSSCLPWGSPMSSGILGTQTGESPSSSPGSCVRSPASAIFLLPSGKSLSFLGSLPSSPK